jgi:hypothetical protein
MKYALRDRYKEMSDLEILEDIELDANLMAALLEGAMLIQRQIDNGSLKSDDFRPRRPTECDPIAAALGEVHEYVDGMRSALEEMEKRGVRVGKNRHSPVYRHGDPDDAADR